ncbi:hypothetical protein HELRODRAFT_179121 [Helobdella robusta]|uniref:Endonuclease/exonuclease/phosphatase domain-containing protein n=1 Tax=Helobdella robusta TaxID=6412 RepID=T1FE70_HELRO|nr:hypothetical protein HELRODRAFT_179121 [Helobdella robusta]ESN95651.1 hypothetical protein HELRODRAFT_179121 [Helobdella robusta]
MEIAEMLERKRINICCLQEIRWKSNGVCHVNSDKEKYKLFWNGQKTAKNGVGIFVREPLAQEVLDIKSINSRLIWIKLRLEKLYTFNKTRRKYTFCMHAQAPHHTGMVFEFRTDSIRTMPSRDSSARHGTSAD